jgi:methylglutaconyl-CoA hydratase
MFCAGADLKERKGMDEDQAREFVRELRATFTMLDQMCCPTISVVDGPALGGGTELALCTDMRICTKDAIFGLPETGLAIIPGAGGTQRLPRLIGISKAKELIFTGDRVNASSALAMGLVNYVCDDYNLATEKAIEIAKKIGEKGPIAIRAAKRAIDGGEAEDLKKGLEFEDKQY